METTTAERVAAGVAFLDEIDPDWWRADTENAIDLEQLNMGNGCMCILGQRCPLEIWTAAAADDDDDYDTPYWAWAAILSAAASYQIVDAWAAERGFQIPSPCYIDDSDAESEYDALTKEWGRVIAERRAAAREPASPHPF